MIRTTVLVAAAALLLGRPHLVSAQIAVQVGDHNLLPNLPGQTIQIFVTGGGAIAGVSLNVQVADGYPDVPGSATDGPDITGIDLVTGTIFAANNTGATDPGSVDQVGLRNITTSANTVPADGILATLTL